jgi:hypothetical protein
MDPKLVFDAIGKEDVLIADESCGWAHILEAEVCV